MSVDQGWSKISGRCSCRAERQSRTFRKVQREVGSAFSVSENNAIFGEPVWDDILTDDILTQ